jgi:hypothetical protein
MIIAIDFDGTLVEHKFPEIGNMIPFAFDVCKEWQKRGHDLILWTCRENKDLDLAVYFCKLRGLNFDSINKNILTLSFDCKPKIYADWYIDDRMFKPNERHLIKEFWKKEFELLNF